MNIEASAPTPQCSVLLTADLGGALEDVEKTQNESSTDTEDTADEEALLAQHDGPATDELARKMLENETRLLQRIARMKQKKKQLKAMLGAYRQKEEFVSRMDSHMDEVESTEHQLSLKIETLTAENQQLRDFTDKRAQDNSESIEKLNETIKQCSESETRVQFLVDQQLEAPGGATERLPAPIGEYEESCSSAPMCDGRRMPLGVVLEAEAPRSPDPELEEEQEVDMDGLGSAERPVEVSDGLQHSGRQTGSPRPPQAPTNSARTSVAGPLYMEQKLREALDTASFECPVAVCAVADAAVAAVAVACASFVVPIG